MRSAHFNHMQKLKVMSTIRAVAEQAGVSVATVSRALRKPGLVSSKTRKKVLEAIDVTGYRPNLMAVRFRSRKSGNLVVLVPTVANTFFSRVIDGIQRAAREKGYGILLCNTLGKTELEDEYAKLVDSYQADGLIQLRAYNPFKDGGSRSGRPPMVNACEVMDNATCPTISIDNAAAARAVTDHLVRHGHRRIGLIQGPSKSPLTRDRLRGYRESLESAGIPFDASLLCPGHFTLQSGHRAAGGLIARDDPPTAIFCENDEMAIGAIQRIKEAGLRVPEDISVAGFDDISFASYCDPPLTTVAQPTEEFGETAVAVLVDLLEGDTGDNQRVTLPYDLVVRESTGPAPG